MKTWLKITIAALAALLVGATICLILLIPRENDKKMIEKIDVEKYASPSLTVSEGGEITYTVKLTSNAGRRTKLLIKDTLPENTIFVGGDFEADGTSLSASVIVRAKETKTVSYTVRLGAAYTNGMYVNAPAASIGEKQTGTCQNYVIRTLQGSEQERMRDAIAALSYSENIAPIKLLRDIYIVAFSETPKFTESYTPAMILDTVLHRMRKRRKPRHSAPLLCPLSSAALPFRPR